MMLLTTTPSLVLLVLLALVRAEEAVVDIEEVEDLTHELDDDSSVNFTVDTILKVVNYRIRKNGEASVKIPGMNKTFTTDICKEEGVFVLGESIVKNIKLLRTGPALVEISSDFSFVISAHLGIDNLTIDYENYDIFTRKLHHQGAIFVSIGNLSILFKLEVLRNNYDLVPKFCSVEDLNFHVERLDRIQVRITNIGLFGDMKNKMILWVGDLVEKRLRSYIEKQVAYEIATSLELFNFCSVRFQTFSDSEAPN